jgi:nucleoside-diphosphate-sugar epimerase
MPAESGHAVVTGCAGFVGSHLTERLLDGGWSVTGIDCFTDFYARPLKEANLLRFVEHRRFSFLEADLAEAPLGAAVAGADVVFHLAAQAGVRQSFGEGFAGYVRNNVLATQRLLEACAGLPLRSFVYASSSSVYGDAHEGPTAEDAQRAPRSPYGMTKLAAEELAGVYHRELGLPVVGLRYFTVYGPRQRPDMAFTRFMTRALAGDPLVIYGDGTQTRDFTYVADAVEGTIAAAVHGVPGRVYNIGGGTCVSVNGVLEEISRLLGRRVEVEMHPPVRGDVRTTCSVPWLARQELRFVPATPLAIGLAAQLEWCAQAEEDQIPLAAAAAGA